jgi:hypothetical protein
MGLLYTVLVAFNLNQGLNILVLTTVGKHVIGFMGWYFIAQLSITLIALTNKTF